MGFNSAFKGLKYSYLLWTHQAYYSMDGGLVCRKKSGRGVNVTTHIYPVSRLRMSEAILLLLYMPS